MSNIAVVTDSNSGISQQEAKELGIQVLPMPFFVNNVLHFEDIDLTQDEFYRRLEEGADVSTSQPSPADVIELWEKLLKNYDEVVHIPMSSGLSNSCETAMMLAREFNGRVRVVNNQRISVTQRQSVMDALELIQAGKTGNSGAGKAGIQHLYHGGYAEISEKGRKNHPGRRHDRHRTERQAGAADPGRPSGRLR